MDAETVQKTADIITEKDKAIIAGFFEARLDLKLEDFEVRLSKAGNLMAMRIGSSDGTGQVVFDRLSGNIIALGRDVEDPGCSERRQQAKAKKKKLTTHRFTDPDLEFVLSAAEGLISCYGDIVEGVSAKMTDDNPFIHVEFIAKPEVAFSLPAVTIHWVKKCKDERYRKQHISSYFSNLHPIPLPDTISKVQTRVFRFVEETVRKYARVDATASPFSKVLPKKVLAAVRSLFNLSAAGADKMRVSFTNGKFKLEYSHIAFECDEGISSPKFTRTSQEHIKRFDDVKRRRKLLEEIVSYASTLEIPGQFSFEYDRDMLYVKATGQRTSACTELAVPGSYKRILSRLASTFRDQEKRAERDAIVSLVEKDISGDLLALAVAVVVKNNFDYITENATIKVLRGLKISEHYKLVRTPYDGQFNIVSDADIRSSVRLLVSSGILWEKLVDGKYTDYYLLKPSDAIDDYIAAASNPGIQVEVLGEQTAREREAVRLADFCQSSTKQEYDDDLDFLIEHPALLCCATEEVSAWLSKLPEEYKEYIGLRTKLEDDAKKKKYLKSLLSATQGNVVSTGKTRRTTSSHGKKKKTKYKAIVSNEISSNLNVRYVVMDTATGDIVDTAQGYGYKTPERAMAAWNYKQKHKR